MHVREMLDSDIPDVAQAHLKAWQAAYRGILSDSMLDGLDRATFERNWQGILHRPHRTTLVIESHGRAIGYIAFGPASTPSRELADGEIIGLYVHPDHWGQGAGSKLLAEALVQLEQRRFSRVIVWTMRDNARARRFYQKHGFTPDGQTRRAARRNETFVEVRLVKAIGIHPASALIVAPSDPLRESLAVLARAIPQIGRIEQATDLDSVLSKHTGAPPDLILCDFESVQDQTITTFQRVKLQWPRVRCVLLVEDETAYRRARAIGADVVLTKGVRAARLLETIEELLA
jgi:ribosomal protein S18 acetylase RimI-like enzyme